MTAVTLTQKGATANTLLLATLTSRMAAAVPAGSATAAHAAGASSVAAKLVNVTAALSTAAPTPEAHVVLAAQPAGPTARSTEYCVYVFADSRKPMGARPVAPGSAEKLATPRQPAGDQAISLYGGAAEKPSALPFGSDERPPMAGSTPQAPARTSEKMGGSGSTSPSSCSLEGERVKTRVAPAPSISTSQMAPVMPMSVLYTVTAPAGSPRLAKLPAPLSCSHAYDDRFQLTALLAEKRVPNANTVLASGEAAKVCTASSSGSGSQAGTTKRVVAIPLLSVNCAARASPGHASRNAAGGSGVGVGGGLAVAVAVRDADIFVAVAVAVAGALAVAVRVPVADTFVAVAVPVLVADTGDALGVALASRLRVFEPVRVAVAERLREADADARTLALALRDAVTNALALRVIDLDVLARRDCDADTLALRDGDDCAATSARGSSTSRSTSSSGRQGACSVCIAHRRAGFSSRPPSQSRACAGRRAF